MANEHSFFCEPSNNRLRSAWVPVSALNYLGGTDYWGANVITSCATVSCYAVRPTEVYQDPASTDRAKQLLLSCLTPEQRKDLEETNHFRVRGLSGNRYRIFCDGPPNIRLYDEEDEIVYRLCLHPKGNLPIYDIMLAQKLMIENDEETFLAVANRHP